MKKVLIIGGTTWDYIVQVGTFPEPVPQTLHQATLHECCGSTGLGKALPLHQLNVPVVLYSALGADTYGAAISSFIRENGLSAYTITDPAGTERHINIMDEAGQRISIFATRSSEALAHDEQLLEKLLRDCDLVVLNIISYCRQLIPLVLRSGKPVWTDLHDFDGSNPYHQDFIDAAAYIQLSSDNLTDYKTVMQTLINQGKKLVVCTHGKKGATLLLPSGEWIEQPALLQEKVADSNGAGDSFFAGLLYGYLQGQDWKTCLQLASICGAAATQEHRITSAALTETYLQAQHQLHFSRISNRLPVK